MKSKLIRIAIAQMNFTVGDIALNSKLICKGIDSARASGADIIVFPELAVTGYPPEDLLMRTDFINSQLNAVKFIAKNTRNISAIFGFADKKGKSLFNSAMLASDGKQLGVYHKIDLPNYGVFDEKRYFAQGEDVIIWEDRDEVRFGITICEDIWNDDGPAVVQGKTGNCDILINISSSPYHERKLAEREIMLKKRARQAGCPILYVNLIGGQDELVFDGGSLLISERGEIIYRAKQFEESLDIFDIELKTHPKRKIRNRRISVKKLSTAVCRCHYRDIVSFLPPTVSERKGKLEEIYSALVLGTRDYVLKNSFKSVVIGISGGIDSALTAAICVDALGRKNVTGITMPSRYTSTETLADSRMLAGNMGIELIEIPIADIFYAYLNALKVVFNKTAPDIAEENLQARIRGCLLMAFSNKFGSLVITTGNKSEISVGYCTLYGDMAGGFAVIKDVPKTLVYKLSDYVNEMAGTEIIPVSTIERAPSAELKPEQKDSDTLPDYELLDNFIDMYIEKELSVDEIIKRGFPRREAIRLVDMIEKSEYKRRQSPPGIKITPKAFGKDRRRPITNKYSRHNGRF